MIQNASQHARVFYARHMQPGTAAYDKETILVDTDGMKALLKTGEGKPVYIHHQNVDLNNLKEEAAGYICDSFYNPLDGWGWFKFIAVDDEAHKAIAKNWSVSNAYRVTQKGPGGTKNNVPYNYEVLDGDFTHLAIVPNPRYENASIMTAEAFRDYQEGLRSKSPELQNSKPTEGNNTMIKFFKTKKEEVSSIDADTQVELENGTSVSVKEMIETVTNAKNSAKKNEKDDEMENAMVDCGDGESMPLKELVNKYNSMKKNEKKNADDAEEMKKKAKDEKENADADDKKDDKKDEKKNGKKKNDDGSDDDMENSKTSKSADAELNANFFNELRNANMQRAQAATTISAPQVNLDRGKSRYGS